MKNYELKIGEGRVLSENRMDKGIQNRIATSDLLEDKHWDKSYFEPKYHPDPSVDEYP